MTEFDLLMTPGPVPMPPAVREALSLPMIHHRTPEFTSVLEKVLEELKGVFKTEQPVMIHTATGSGAMESAIVNCLSKGDEVLCVVSGKFGQRWAEQCQSYGVVVHELLVEWGNSFKVEDVSEVLSNNPNIKAVLTQYCETSTATLHPVPELAEKLKGSEILLMVDAITAIGAAPLAMDDMGIDVVVAGSQKAFMMPTGLSFIALSEKAWQAQAKSDLPKYYWDLKKELDANDKGQTRFSSAISHIRALHAALSMMSGELLGQQMLHTKNMAEASRKALQAMGLEIFSSSPSDSVTAFAVPSGLDGVGLRNELENKYKVTLMGGQDHLKGKILRLGHLGYIQSKDLIICFERLGKALRDFGFDLPDEKFSTVLKDLEQDLRES